MSNKNNLNKWRPDYRSYYVIPEVCGNNEGLDLLLKRILPLRYSGVYQDRLVFLGNYLSGDIDGAGVIEHLISIQKEYGDEIIFLRGRDEELLLKALFGSEQDYKLWLYNYHGSSIIESYLRLKNTGLISPSAGINFTQSRFQDLIPATHLTFFKSLLYYYRHLDYLFLWGGLNLEQSLEQNNLSNMVFDISTAKIIRDRVIAGRIDLIEKSIALKNVIGVSSFNCNKSTPFICSKWFSLAIGGPKNLGVFDLETCKMIRLKKGKERPYLLNFNIFS